MSSRRPAGSAQEITGGRWYALCGRYDRKRLIIANASCSDAATRSTAALRPCTAAPPSCSLVTSSPAPLRTTGGPAQARGDHRHGGQVVHDVIPAGIGRNVGVAHLLEHLHAAAPAGTLDQ